jgi:hypothetical protein
MENPLCRHLSVKELFAVPQIPNPIGPSQDASTSHTVKMVVASQQPSGHLSTISKKSKVSVQKVVLVLIVCVVAAHVYNEINIRKRQEIKSNTSKVNRKLPSN